MDFIEYTENIPYEILEIILGKLETKHLIPCRLVSSRWNIIATSKLKQKESYIQFHNQSSQQDNYQTNPERLKEFCTLMKSSRDFPYSAFQFCNISHQHESVQEFFTLFIHFKMPGIRHLPPATNDIWHNSTTHLLYFIQAFSSSLEILQIQRIPYTLWCTIYKPLLGQSKNKHIENPTLPVLNLKKIIFAYRRYNVRPQFDALEETWEAILRVASGLDSVEMYPFQEFSILELLSNTNRLSQLTHLSLVILLDSHMDLLLASELSLLHFSFHAAFPFTNKLEHLLEKLSPNLKELGINNLGMGDNNTVQIHFPKMLKLTRLKMNPFDCTTGRLILRGLNFPVKTPSLQFIELHFIPSSTDLNWEMFSSNSEDFQVCKELSELSIDFHFRGNPHLNFLEHFGRIFPNVKALTLTRATTEIKEEMLGIWQNLIELNLEFCSFHDNHCEDVSICGIPIWLKEQFGNGGVDTGKPGWWKNVKPLFLREKSICNLKELTRLRVRDKDIENRFLMTDLSGYFALSKLQNLQLLSITKSKISKGCVTYLQEKLPLISDLYIGDREGKQILQFTR